MAAEGENVDAFKNITGTDDERAKFYLDAAGGDLGVAISTYFEDGSKDDDVSGSINAQQESMDEGESSPPHEPSPPPIASSSIRPKRSQPPQPAPGRIATLASYKNERDDDSSSDEERQSFFVGGSRDAGQEVVGPKKKKPERVINDMFKSAKEQGAEEVSGPAGGQSSSGASSSFVGSGFRLGYSNNEESAPVQGVQGAAAPAVREERVIVLKLYRNGFCIDDGDLRSFEDPQNSSFLDAIKRGEVPEELRRMVSGGKVALDMEDHRNEDFVPTKRPLKAFSGEGNTLGGVSSSSIGSSNQPVAASSTASPVSPSAVAVDTSQPLTSIQIRLTDGTRLISKFNQSHTVGDIRRFVASSRPEFISTPFMLMTTFPKKELVDDSVSIKDGDLMNAVIVQKKL